MTTGVWYKRWNIRAYMAAPHFAAPYGEAGTPSSAPAVGSSRDPIRITRRQPERAAAVRTFTVLAS